MDFKEEKKVRKELQPPSINEELLPVVEELIESIAVKLENECIDINEKDEISFEDDEIAKEVNEKCEKLKELTKKDVQLIEFYHYWNHISLEDIASEFLLPDPPSLNDITLEELSEIIEEFFTMEHIELFHETYYIKLIEKNFRLSGISDYIFYPDSKGVDDNPSAIAEKIIEDSKNPPVICL